jgi:hypothetical protein
MSSIVERRLLVNYRVDPEAAASLLPAPLRPQLVNGWAVAGICLIRLGRLRPSWVPGWAGMRTENAAHRIAVEWDGTGGRQSGVYIPRRDSNSVATVLAGGRLFPGEHHRASFDVRETAQDLHVAFASTDGTAHVSIDVRVAQRLQGSALFADLREASDFFRRGSAGFSATRDSGRLDGLELRADRWVVEPAEVHAVCSSFFSDVRLFPPGSATLDCALLMRDIPVTWTATQPAFPVSERQESREVALHVSPGQLMGWWKRLVAQPPAAGRPGRPQDERSVACPPGIRPGGASPRCGRSRPTSA